jgi:hypothetical protein
VALTGGSAAYALSTASTPHTGSVPSAGPTVASAGGFGGGPGGTGGGFGGGRPGGTGSSSGSGSFGPPSGTGGKGGFPGGGSGSFTPPTGAGGQSGTGTAEGGFPGSTSGTSGTRGTAGAGFAGGAGGGTTTSAALTALLKATTTKWAAATIGSQTAGPLELASGKAVMSIGGFNGGDNAPTLAQFEAYVASGQIRYFIAGGQGGGQGGPGGGNSSGSAITSWVESHFSSTTVGGTTVYDLTKAAS